jgi:hypothetical protein
LYGAFSVKADFNGVFPLIWARLQAGADRPSCSVATFFSISVLLASFGEAGS